MCESMGTTLGLRSSISRQYISFKLLVSVLKECVEISIGQIFEISYLSFHYSLVTAYESESASAPIYCISSAQILSLSYKISRDSILTTLPFSLYINLYVIYHMLSKRRIASSVSQREAKLPWELAKLTTFTFSSSHLAVKKGPKSMDSALLFLVPTMPSTRNTVFYLPLPIVKLSTSTSGICQIWLLM